ncbi:MULTISPECIES: Ger(x)C family spore germination protein [Bhargavaea]|uniref:Ger(X)C family spore germination protein n=1 Tax=Bhargavaea changchunensis TaxID=2134037 RepID=A0ABW2NJY2_9BACL|nr:Ger(x)C family spore germination protein [Bhargavaea sp. CC-171006]
MRWNGWKLGMVLVILLLVSGCGERRELETSAFVSVIGLDKAEQDHQVKVTFQISNPQVNTTQSAEAQKEPPSDIVTITSVDLLSAKELAQSSLSREITFSHLQTIIVGEELARDDLFKHIIGSAIIDPEMRRETIMIVSKERAQAFIHANKPTMETRPHKYYQFMEDNWRKTGFSPVSNLNAFFQRTEGELFLAAYATAERDPIGIRHDDDYSAGEVPQDSGDPVQMIGSAVMQEGKMVGMLNGEETRISQLLRRKNLIETMTAEFPDPLNENYQISLVLNQSSHTEIEVDTDRSPVKIDVKVPLQVKVNSNIALEDFTASQKRRDALREMVKEKMEEASDSLIKKLQENYTGEPFVWYATARRNFWTVSGFENFEWGEKFKEADVDLHYEVSVTSFGEQLSPPAFKKFEEDK